MFQPNDRIPDAPRQPPPWSLQGAGWIIALRLPAGSPARDAFLPADLAGQGRSPVSLLMYVDYATSGCGPYRELLFIPGAYPFEDGRRHFTISRILVSTWSSVVNGRANWGIPKDRADFDVQSNPGDPREQRIRVLADDGREMCSLRLAASPFAPRLPVPGSLVPERFRTLAQRFDGKTFYYAPASGGWLRPGRLLEWQFDPGLFPDLREASVVAACQVPSFRMAFPFARVVARE
jgi:hypothetical protein